MTPGSLNVDTRYNIIRRMLHRLPFAFVDADVRSVSPKFHRAFDTNKWLLLPETRILNAYHNVTNPDEFPSINVYNPFHYSVLCG